MKKLYIAALFAIASTIASAQFTKIFDFSGAADGNQPYGALISDGTFLYGMTYIGGANNDGVIFKIKTDGTGYVDLFDFSGAADGKSPRGSLISDGTYLYGTTRYGGASNDGVIFKIKPDGTGYTKLFEFNGTDGLQPLGSLIYDGNFLYGTTEQGGTSAKCVNGCGVAFRIKPDGTGDTTLLDFSTGGVTAMNPYGSLVSDGTFLYGMTRDGGVSNYGVIFKIKPDGTGYTDLLDFAGTANGRNPDGSLILNGGFLYGMTQLGGTNNVGTIFRIKPDGTGDTILFNFSGAANGSNTHSSLIYDGNFLFGMAYQGGSSGVGTMFKIKPNGIGYTKLSDFAGAANGSNPQGDLFSDGSTLYGMTYGGGINAMGTVFKYQYCTMISDSLTISPPNCGSNNGSVTVLPSGGAGNYTYKWNNGDSTATVSGLSGSPTDTLVVKITDSNGCFHIDTTRVSCLTGITQITNINSEIFVYPNPSYGKFIFESGIENQELGIKIYNMLGKEVYSQHSIHSSQFEIDLSNQPAGIYLYRILSEKGEYVASGKVVTEK
ncbi:MAG TPA: choice-of-anchor tandem repeat GloVer-containing protein [Bacteroidia bacterium]|jgi:uncharacterized repeat protein (TIGR03803 family)|nr:choice-of-anchor tandem repeat GloVer-containing protein [Bacteroidia bacterium]